MPSAKQDSRGSSLEAQLPLQQTASTAWTERNGPCRYVVIILAFIAGSFLVNSQNLYTSLTEIAQWITDKDQAAIRGTPLPLQDFKQCSIKNIEATGFAFLDAAHPITHEEFAGRRQRLGQALMADGADAFVVEPGYTFSYYANITQRDWEVWEPEERPFLLVIQSGGSKKARSIFLVPTFEAERARLLGMPFSDDENVTWVTYEEHWDPFATLASSGALVRSNKSEGADAPLRVVVDEEMRDFISRGLAGQRQFTVSGLGGEVERVRQIKTQPEVEILRAVNTGTIEG